MNKRRQWTETDKQELADAVRRNSTLHAAFMAVAQTTGHSYKSVSNLYYRERSSSVSESSTEDSTSSEVKSSPKRWTEEEEQSLIKNVEQSVNNLHAAFIACAKEIDRTPLAIQSHWYAITSKRKDVNVIVTASRNAIARNRKNSGFVQSNSGIWKRILRIVQTIIH